MVSDSSATSKGKQKKKAKKSGRTIQEEEDLDAILAELDGPGRGAAPPPAEVVEPEVSGPPTTSEAEDTPLPAEPSLATEATETEEVAESAAAKKKKKKKEKEKAKAGAG